MGSILEKLCLTACDYYHKSKNIKLKVSTGIISAIKICPKMFLIFEFLPTTMHGDRGSLGQILMFHFLTDLARLV